MSHEIVPTRPRRRARARGDRRRPARPRGRARPRGPRRARPRHPRASAPAPESDFAAKLDEWAAAGFPRDGRMSDGGEGQRGPALGGLRERLRTVPPRRLLLPVGAAATVLVAAAVGISVSDQLGGSNQTAPSIRESRGPWPSRRERSRAAIVRTIASPAAPAKRWTRPDSTSSSRARSKELQGAQRATAELAPRSPLARCRGQRAPGGPRKVAQNADLVLSTEPQDVRDVADSVSAWSTSTAATSSRRTSPAGAHPGRPRCRERPCRALAAGQRHLRAPDPGAAPPGRAGRHVEARPTSHRGRRASRTSRSASTRRRRTSTT